MYVCMYVFPAYTSQVYTSYTKHVIAMLAIAVLNLYHCSKQTNIPRSKQLVVTKTGSSL